MGLEDCCDGSNEEEIWIWRRGKNGRSVGERGRR